ncbi:MAG: alanine racemase [Candidatus Limnocylindrales bacterium]
MTGSIAQRLAAAGLPPLPRTAWLEIDLDALRANLAALRDLAGVGVPVTPVVKADAYGHGAVPVARALEAAGADGFCVAAIDEAFALRDGGLRGPIRVLYPVPAGFGPTAARERIAVSVGAMDGLRDLLAACARGIPTDGLPLDLELELETGLGRGGVDPAQAVPIARSVAAAAGAQLIGLWTHLQASEDPVRTAAQLARFHAVVAELRAAGIDLPARHVAASGGVLGDVAALDGVRPGLAIYGLVPDEFDDGALDPARTSRLQPVLSLHAQPVRVADLPSGHGVSYGPTFTTGRPSRIATLPVGYGDGFTRQFSNRAVALVRGVRAPVVGNVAMDAVMVDVTDVPGPPITSEDEFVLLGRLGDATISARDLAQERTTNTWEVVTQMSRRLPRVYHAASAPVELRTLSERRG